MRKAGEKMEELACRYLQARGLEFIEANYQCYSGEIDLIMRDKEHIVFVEVRHRADAIHGSALESITPAKIKKLVKAATLYLQRRKWLHTVNSRFDVVALDGAANAPRVSWIKNAFYP